MDLETECSALESVEENEVNPGNSLHADENGTKNNGSCANDSCELGCDGNFEANLSSPDHKGKVVEVVSEEPMHLSAKNLQRGSPPATKGFGLKKWRRIKRDFVKDPNTCLDFIDSSKILKRGLSAPANSTKSQLFPHVIKQSSAGLLGSSNILEDVGLIYGSALCGSSSDSRYAVGSAFAVGTVSDVSEDQSSKSSTAACAPQSRYDLPAALGYARDKNRIRSMSSKNVANSAHRGQHGKGLTEGSKKPKGERVIVEKENSHSSIESDSRSSNFKQGVFTVASNGKHSHIYNIGNSDDAHTNEHCHEEFQAGYCNENVGEDGDVLQENLATNLSWDAKEEKSEKKPSTVEDPLIETIHSLQSVQEALQEEVQKLGDIGIEPLSPNDDSIKCTNAAADVTDVDPGLCNSFMCGQSGVEGIRQTTSSSLELQVISLTQSVNILESKFEESRRMLALKNSRIVELETALGSGKFLQEESGSTIGLSEEKYKEVDSQLEDLFRQKIESEVEYLAITKIMQNLKVGAEFQLTLLEEQEILSGKQAQVLNKLGEAVCKPLVLKNHTEELDKHFGDISGVEESFMMQKRVCEVTSCFFIQLMLLILVFWLFLSQLSSNSGVAVPT